MRRFSPTGMVMAALPWSWFLIRGANPWMEVVAVLLPPIGVAAVVLAAVTTYVERARLLRTLAISTAVVVTLGCVAPRLPTLGDESSGNVELTVIAANVTGDNRDAGQAVTRLLAESPDVLVLEEVNPQVRRRLEEIRSLLPHTAGTGAVDSAETMVFSTYPLTQVQVPIGADNGRVVAVLVDAPIPFIVVGAHLPRPWFQTNEVEMLPRARHDLVDSLATWIATLDRPVILAGDLNATDRGLDYRTLVGAGHLQDSMRSDWASDHVHEVVATPAPHRPHPGRRVLPGLGLEPPAHRLGSPGSAGSPRVLPVTDSSSTGAGQSRPITQ